jgi:hypothetical protein
LFGNNFAEIRKVEQILKFSLYKLEKDHAFLVSSHEIRKIFWDILSLLATFRLSEIIKSLLQINKNQP